MADKVFRKNNFYERPWTSLLRRIFLENLRGECHWIRCYGIPEIFSAAHCSPPNSNCFIVIAIQFNVKRKICVWENIFGDGWERMWKMHFIGCEMISDFVSEICDFFSWQSLPIGDHLIPIPWRAWRTRVGNWDLWSNFALCQKWFFSSKA